MTVYDTLYKLTSTGSVQYWQVSVDGTEEGYGKIITEYGKLDTDKPQITIDIIKEGKNIGKISETTPHEQAVKEAEAKHNKQLKSGYVDCIEKAKEGGVDDIIEGGILPMLAHDYNKHKDKIKFPCYSNVKFDGIRCIGIVKNGKASLWSRSRKRITSMPHIEKELELFGIDIVTDGELYNHEYKNKFEEIVSLVRQEEPAKNCTEVQYHIYDIINSDIQSDRYETLDNLFNDDNNLEYIMYADYVILNSNKDVDIFLDQALKDGYEGIMLRNSDALYENKRSYNLMKLKTMQDSEFPIIGITEGRGKLIGHAATFICKTPEGRTFEAKMKGELSKLKEYFEDSSLWKNKLLTVQYQGVSSEDKIPRFPVGKSIRDYE